MNNYSFTAENILRALPVALQNDPTMVALGETIAQVFTAIPTQLDATRIYAQIDQLESDLLDILAVDFKVDWWDADYTLEEKRQTLKDSWAVHRTLGTKGAVETAISAIYSDTTVSEWFEYDGSPFHFKLLVDVSYENVDPEKHARVLSRLKYYQNLRSVLDGISYVAAPDGSCSIYGGIALAGLATNITTEVAIYGLD